MTLVFAWLRNVGEIQEFVVASDSRLSGDGATWDACPKILQLPRTDAVMAFCGSTAIAYPALLQISKAVQSNPAQRERRYDIADTSDLVRNILNQMLDKRDVERFLRDSVALEKSQTQLLLAGYSWRYSEFRAWTYVYNPKKRVYERIPLRIAKDAAGRKSTLRWTALGDLGGLGGGVLRQRLKASEATSLDMEPLEVLRDLIRSGQHHTIGGAPQVVKIYRHMNSQTFGVLWREHEDGQAVATYGGRPLLDYEKAYYTFIDTDAPRDHASAALKAETAGDIRSMT
ncbi:hypothetical protein [Geodermatophilus normandii]|uniref:hypothetical protein n=1 Tax=Geodermatophilus normandii TaxID=1137989 RepID=UPI0011B44F37|nr:hypothetical protein [Geodermatophilus normandii]